MAGNPALPKGDMLRSDNRNTAAQPAPEDRDDGYFHGVTNNAMLCGAAVEPDADRARGPCRALCRERHRQAAWGGRRAWSGVGQTGTPSTGKYEQYFSPGLVRTQTMHGHGHCCQFRASVLFTLPLS